jgi:hypothetical protein
VEAALRELAATEDRSLKFNLMAHPLWPAYLNHTLQSRLVTWLETFSSLWHAFAAEGTDCAGTKMMVTTRFGRDWQGTCHAESTLDRR